MKGRLIMKAFLDFVYVDLMSVSNNRKIKKAFLQHRQTQAIIHTPTSQDMNTYHTVTYEEGAKLPKSQVKIGLRCFLY